MNFEAGNLEMRMSFCSQKMLRESAVERDVKIKHHWATLHTRMANAITARAHHWLGMYGKGGKREGQSARERERANAACYKVLIGARGPGLYVCSLLYQSSSCVPAFSVHIGRDTLSMLRLPWNCVPDFGSLGRSGNRHFRSKTAYFEFVLKGGEVLKLPIDAEWTCLPVHSQI